MNLESGKWRLIPYGINAMKKTIRCSVCEGDVSKIAKGLCVKLLCQNNLEKLLLKELQGLDFIRNGSEKRLPGLVSLSFHGVSGETLLHRPDLMKILVSTGSACNSENLELSHVLSAMGVSEEYAMGTIRISLGQENGADDIHRIANAIRRIIVA